MQFELGQLSIKHSKIDLSKIDLKSYSINIQFDKFDRRPAAFRYLHRKLWELLSTLNYWMK